MNHIYVFFFERKLEFANSFEGIYIYIYIYVWKVGTEPPKGAMVPLDFYF